MAFLKILADDLDEVQDRLDMDAAEDRALSERIDDVLQPCRTHDEYVVLSDLTDENRDYLVFLAEDLEIELPEQDDQTTP